MNVINTEPEWVSTLKDFVYDKQGEVYCDELVEHWTNTINERFQGRVLSIRQLYTVEAFNKYYEDVINDCLLKLGKPSIKLNLNEVFKEYQGVD